MRALLLGLVFSVVGGASAWADLDQAIRDCIESPSQQRRIEACTRVLSEPSLTGRHRAAAHFNRGIAYRMLKRYRRAIADYDQAIKLNPQYAEAYYNRGVSYEILGRKAEAIADYREALALGIKAARQRIIALGAKP
jgi:tetratricopeptide (TPR) repeat protein